MVGSHNDAEDSLAPCGRARAAALLGSLSSAQQTPASEQGCRRGPSGGARIPVEAQQRFGTAFLG